MSPAAARNPLTWLGALLVAYLLVPIGAFVVRFAEHPAEGFGSAGLASAFGTSVLSASISTLVIVLLGVPLAYRLARSKGRIAVAVGVLVQLPLALPPVMSGIVLIYVIGPYTLLGRLFHGGLTDSVVGVIIAQTFVASPFLVIAARSAFAAVDPALDDLAAGLGHRPFARFWRVAVPAASGGIAAGILLTWLRALGEYGATVLLAYHPYTLPVFTSVQFQGAGIPGTQAPTALAVAIAIVAVLLGVVRWPRRGRGRRGDRGNDRRMLGSARPPHPASPTRVAFDLDQTFGSFHLSIAHRATSHRIAILGPSGSGKTMMLRSLAGLTGAASGAVSFAGVDVTALEAPDRGVGFLPQGGTLLPGRPVAEQVMFGVGADRDLAAWWIDMLQIGGLEGRLPSQLSGGQRQRVGLAQVLSRSPGVVLLDEPFSALDAPVRDGLRRALRRLQLETGLSTVLVTHDPEEAALLADEIVVIARGRLLQAGPRAEVFGFPATLEVAGLLGVRNVASARVVSTTSLDVGGIAIEVATHSFAVGDDVLWRVTPNALSLASSTASGYPARIAEVVDLGTETSLTVVLEGGRQGFPEPELRMPAPVGSAPSPGDRCRLALPAEAVVVWRGAKGSATVGGAC